MQQERFPTALAAEFAADSVAARGEIGNVGPGGLFVEARSVPETGEMVRLTFDAPDGERILLSGIVWWAREPGAGFGRRSGFGVRLLEATDRYEAFIDRLGDERRADGNSKGVFGSRNPASRPIRGVGLRLRRP